MKRFVLLAMLFSSVALFGGLVRPVREELMPRLPEWKPTITEQHATGRPKTVYFFLEVGEGKSVVKKRVTFYENDVLKEETDMIQVEEGSPGHEKWGAILVPHGASVSFDEEGKMQAIAYFDRGLFHGPKKLFYKEGNPAQIECYKQDKLHGERSIYYEDGQKAEISFFRDGKPVGDTYSYYEDGSKKSLVTFEDGKRSGKSFDWYESGKIKVEANYLEGELHSTANTPAVVHYNESHQILEVQEFNKGTPIKSHITYHENGKRKSVVSYKDGVKNGKEELFDIDGKKLGEGLFVKGVPTGKHYRNYPNGKTAYLAFFDKKGKLKEPIKEYAENGNLTAKYQKEGEKFLGEFLAFYEDGTPKSQLFYGEFGLDGKQLEYYENGNLKTESHYSQGKHHGITQEFYENGVKHFTISFKNDVRDGDLHEWYKNGNMHFKQSFKEGQFDGFIEEWHENGNLSFSGSFKEGKRQGPHQSFSEEGTLLFSATYQDDQYIGEMLAYYPDGTLKERKHFKEEKKKVFRKNFIQISSLCIKLFIKMTW